MAQKKRFTLVINTIDNLNKDVNNVLYCILINGGEKLWQL